MIKKPNEPAFDADLTRSRDPIPIPLSGHRPRAAALALVHADPASDQAILVPITASRTSNLRRTMATLFGVEIAQSRYDTFMASVKLAWGPVWEILRRAIPDPLTDGRLLLAVDDSVNPKTGRKVFACQTTFDHAAKTNQSQFPWAQTMVTVGGVAQDYPRTLVLSAAGLCLLFSLPDLA